MNWVRDNYEVKANVWYKRFRNTHKENKKYPIPYGNVTTVENYSMFPTYGPEIKYQRGNEYACAAYSLSGVLYIIGDNVMHHVVFNEKDKSINQIENGTMFYLVRVMRGDKIFVKFNCKKYGTRKIEDNEHSYSFIIDNPTADIKMLKVSVTHCVCIWRNWVFYTNYSNSLSLKKKWLLWCSQQHKKKHMIQEKCYDGYELITPKIVKKNMPDNF